MKAVQFAQFGGPEVLHLQEIADPTPALGDLLIDVKATTVNHLDLFQRDGSRPVPLPYTPGLEAAGVVLQDGLGFHAGDRVVTSQASSAKGGGGYASRLAVSADLLARIPDGVSFQEAVSAGLAASTAWGALFDLGHLRAGERVLIWAGSSGVGSIAIQLAKHAGAWVATTASSEQRSEALHTLGADLVINHKQQDIAHTLQEHGGVDLVCELVGATLQTSLDACAKHARVVLVGNLGGQAATINTQSWRLKLATVIGGGLLHTTTANEETILRLIAEQAVKPLIARTFPIEQAAEAHRLLASGEPQGKLVLIHDEN